jgi:hypothetical protein
LAKNQIGFKNKLIFPKENSAGDGGRNSVYAASIGWQTGTLILVLQKKSAETCSRKKWK